MKYFFLLITYISVCDTFIAQYAVKDIPPSLMEDVNAVIREESTVHELKDYDAIETTYKQVVTVLNRQGLSVINRVVGYDSSSSIKEVSFQVYDENGRELKKYKKRDFMDVSASGGSLYTDDRVLYVEHHAVSYPFTCEFNYIRKSSSTAFLRPWIPIPEYEVSVENSSYTVRNEKEIPLTARKYNLTEFNVEFSETPLKYSYQVANLKPETAEELSPHFTEYNPMVKIALQKFQLENNSAFVKTWTDFGLWQKNSLLKGRDEIPDATKKKIEALVAGLDDPKEKARKIYEYMQNKTRYISIQVGIGGWQPTMAAEVDKLNYGDCKGLTNYTMALLKSQGIESYYTLIDSGADGKDFDEDFVALQGDHAILTVPFEDENVFLECTNQELPFNYLGKFTDNRKALMVTPEGGVMVQTHVYPTEQNLQSLKAVATISPDLNITGKISETSHGILYDDKYALESAKSDDLEMYYKNIWGHLNALQVENVLFENNKDAIVFTENLSFSTNNYVSKAGDRILLNPNLFNRADYIPDQETNRRLPIKVRRGRTVKDEIEINLPEGYEVEASFDPVSITNQFGSYNAKVEQVNSSKIIYKREFIFNSGLFPKEDFADFRDFWKTVVKKDKSKIVLMKNTK